MFTLEKREKFTAKYPGPGVFYITEGEHLWPPHLSYRSDLLNGIGEAEIEDTAKPGNPTVLGPGAVVHVEKGSALHWSSPSVAKGECYFEFQFRHSLTSL